MSKPPLLCLVHRIPYPPDKGDKIRSYNLLLGLVQEYDVHLGTFVDDPEDLAHRGVLEAHCRSCKFVQINPLQRTVFSASALLTGEPLSVRFYRSSTMADWVKDVLSKHPGCPIYVFSSTMGQFVPATSLPNTIVDLVDVDSDKWRQYSQSKPFPLSLIYAREAQRLLEQERSLADAAAATTLVSDKEADFFKQQAPGAEEKIHALLNGVDMQYFHNKAAFQSQPLEGEPVLTFVGAMDYWANVDAVVWFAKEALPRLLQQYPNTKFYIVGSKPTAEVKSLASANVVVTGRVEDVRPYMDAADIIVAPLRIARGIQNKVLEALSFGKPVVASSMAMEGIECSSVRVADTAENTADAIGELYRDKETSAKLGREARAFVEQEFAWSVSQQQLSTLLKRAAR